MQDHDTTSESPTSEVELTEVEQVLVEAVREIPVIPLPAGLSVTAEVLPYAIGRMHPVCLHTTPLGDHRISNPLVWKNLDTNEVFCSLYCAVLEAIAVAARPDNLLDAAERLFPEEATRG